MKRNLVLVGLTVILLPVVIWAYGGGWFSVRNRFRPRTWKRPRLADGSPEGQQKAAVALITLGDAALPSVRRVLQQSQSPEVRAIMLQGIAQTRDLDSLEDVLKALDDDAYVVRVQAISAVQRLLFFGQLFKPDAPHEVRVKAIKKGPQANGRYEN